MMTSTPWSSCRDQSIRAAASSSGCTTASGVSTPRAADRIPIARCCSRMPALTFWARRFASPGNSFSTSSTMRQYSSRYVLINAFGACCAHPLGRLRDRHALPPRRVQRGGVDRLTLAEKDEQAFVREVGREVAVHAAVAVALAERQQIVEVDESEAGAMNQPVHLRERQVREANRRVHQASGARAHGPPGRMLRQMLLDLLDEHGLGIRPHQRVHVAAVLEE